MTETMAYGYSIICENFPSLALIFECRKFILRGRIDFYQVFLTLVARITGNAQ